MNFYEKIDDEDILNDPKQLFIEDEQFEEDTVDIVPKVYYESDKTILKSPSGDKGKQENEIPVSVSVIEEKVKGPTKQEPVGKESSEATPKEAKEVIKKPNETTKAKEVAKDIKETTKDTKNVSKCKNNSDCDSNSFCIPKTGKCTAKLQLNEAGCDMNDECAHPLAVCYTKTCMLSCKVGSDSICKAEGEGFGCVEVKDMNVFRGFNGKFNGVCDKMKSTVTKRTNTTKSGNMKFSSVALISGVSVFILTLLIICFIYLRGHFKRRHRNNNPNMFLFNRLQRSASQSLAMVQKSDSVERLNARLMSVSGARFTRWAAMGNENGCMSP